MELSKDQALARLANPANLASRFSSPGSSRLENRPITTKRFIPPRVRNEVALRAVARAGTQAEIAHDFGVTQGEVSALKTGKVQSDVRSNGQVERVLEGARDLALKRLMETLGFIDEDRLSKASLKDLSGVASSMSKVIDKTMPKRDEGSNVTLIVYSPEIKSEASYKIIEVNK